MRKHYAQKDKDGNLTATIHTSEAMDSPWFESDQDFLCTGMVWDEATSQFVIPPEPEPEPTPDP